MVIRREGPSTCPFLRSTHVLWLVLETYTGLDARTNHIGPPDHCHVKENHVTGACDLRASVFDSWRAPLRIRFRLRSVDQRYNINLCHVLAHRSTFSECSRRCTSEIDHPSPVSHPCSDYSRIFPSLASHTSPRRSTFVELHGVGQLLQMIRCYYAPDAKKKRG